MPGHGSSAILGVVAGDAEVSIGRAPRSPSFFIQGVFHVKQRLLRRETVLAVLNKLQRSHPIRVMGEEGRRIYGPNEMFTLMVDYDDLVAELNDHVYKT